MNQRWRNGRDSYRPKGETIKTSEYDVVSIPDDTTARAFIEQHHYSHSMPPVRRRFGLYRKGELVGVSTLSQQWKHVVQSSFPRLDVGQVVELSRFVLRDDVPTLGETWTLARVFDLLRTEGFRAVLSFSDPVPRTDIHGRVIFPGHIGTIYQAHNAVYTGVTGTETLWLYPDATAMPHRDLTKVKKLERGWPGVVERLVSFGADPLPKDADFDGREQWVEYWRSKICRPMRHTGNHRYVWRLNRRVALPIGAMYPKREAA